MLPATPAPCDDAAFTPRRRDGGGAKKRSLAHKMAERMRLVDEAEGIVIE